MQLTGNKGEWSELYAFLKILSDKELHSADESLALIPNSFLKVLGVIRKEGNEDIFYDIDAEQNRILIKKGEELLGIIPILKITSKLAAILERIKAKAVSKGAFSLPEAEHIMQELHCIKVTSSTSKKTDLALRILDPNTGTQPIRGFSIKSKIGGLSTLLNASGVTNFEYEIIKTEKPEYKGLKPLIGLKSLLSADESLQFLRVPNTVFQRNLSMIDSRMPEIMGEMVKDYYLGLGSSSIELINLVEGKDPLQIGNHKHFYEYKLQELLLASAFGMQPSKPWNGSYETHGGYIIVKENGELACYHVYDRDRFRKFLYYNTKFETPSRTKHHFGKVYEKNGRKFILLTLQIRFKN